jgi:hypothetical protein
MQAEQGHPRPDKGGHYTRRIRRERSKLEDHQHSSQEMDTGKHNRAYALGLVELLSFDNQVHKPLLQLAAINVLTLQRSPESCQTHLLRVVISPTFSSADNVGKIEIPRSFKLEDVFVHSIADALETHRPSLPDIDMVFAGIAEKSEAIRKQRGVGIVVVVVYVTPLKMMQIIPFGLADSLQALRVNRHWKDTLTAAIAAGRVI